MSQRVAESENTRLFDRSTSADLDIAPEIASDIASEIAEAPDSRAERRSSEHLGSSRTIETKPSYLELARAESSRSTISVDRWLRALDIAGSICGLVLATPLMLLAALAIRIGSRGPILYRQERIGRWGEPFIVLKLRTMAPSADRDLADMLGDPHYRAQWSESRKFANDPRITRVGRFLRAADLDELPQLWNVLKGEMSLVGPRPVPDEESERYRSDLTKVLSVRPGVTGLWQVSGRNAVSYDRRISLDLTYVDDRSVSLNVRLIAKTLVQLVLRRGLPQA